MNGDALELANMIQNLGQNLNERLENQTKDLKKEISKISVDFATHKSQANLRIQTLEDDQKRDRFWHRVQAVIVLPIAGALHQFATWFGWIK